MGVARREGVHRFYGQRRALCFECVGEGLRHHTGRRVAGGARDDEARGRASDDERSID